jgi:hypothetical protein
MGTLYIGRAVAILTENLHWSYMVAPVLDAVLALADTSIRIGTGLYYLINEDVGEVSLMPALLLLI